MGVALTIFQVLWFIWPAYVANAFPMLLHGKKPIDAGMKLGKMPLLGKSKTIEGTAGGIIFGILVGLVQMGALRYLPPSMGLMDFTLPMIVLLSVGALVGDIVGSFVKRRLGMKPGHPSLLLDQLDFLVGAMVFVSLVFAPSLEMIVILVIMTPVIHFLTNYAGYLLKLKRNPW